MVLGAFSSPVEIGKLFAVSEARSKASVWLNSVGTFGDRYSRALASLPRDSRTFCVLGAAAVAEEFFGPFRMGFFFSSPPPPRGVSPREENRFASESGTTQILCDRFIGLVVTARINMRSPVSSR